MHRNASICVIVQELLVFAPGFPWSYWQGNQTTTDPHMQIRVYVCMPMAVGGENNAPNLEHYKAE